MDEQTNDLVDQTVKSGASTETKETLSKADADYKRDMLKYKDELTALRDQLKEIELEKEQKKGNLEGVIGSLKDEIKHLKADNAKSKYSFAETQLNSAIRQELLGRGVAGKKLDAFMKLVDDNDKSIVELDESFNVSNDDVKSLVDKNMERYGDLFAKPVRVVDGVPSNNAHNTQPKKIDVSKMSWDEAVAYAKTLDK